VSSVFNLQGLGAVGADEQAIYPDVLVEVDWDNDGIFEGGNEDLSTTLRDVRMLECWRGRDIYAQHVGRSVPGHLLAILHNDDDRYNSGNSGSPLFGSLLPGRKIRVRQTTPYPIVLWNGFTGEIKPRIMQSRQKYAELPAAGPLSRVAVRRVALAMGTDVGSGAAIDDVLDAAGWPAGDRSIDTGQETLGRYWTDFDFAINALREIEDTEAGFIAESNDGKILFEERHHRLESPHATSWWAFSDDGTDTNLRYQVIEQLEAVPLIFNVVEVRVRRFTIGGVTALWTHPDRIGESDVPTIAPGQTKDFWAVYPFTGRTVDDKLVGDAVGVDAWTTPVLGTDITAVTVNNPIFPDVAATYLTIVATKYGQRMKFTLENTGPYLLYLNLAARGTRVSEDDPILLQNSDATSIARYGERTFPTRTVWGASAETAGYWMQFVLNIYKDPMQFVAIEFNANKSLLHAHAASKIQISDRISIKANGEAGLGINEDFFVERKNITIRPGKEVWCRLECSPADLTGGFAVLDDTTLGLLDTAKLGF